MDEQTKELLREIEREQDSERLLELVEELNRLLEKRDRKRPQAVA